MRTKDQVLLFLCGDSLSFKKPWDGPKKTGGTSEELSKGKELKRKRRRTIKGLIRALCSIKNQHQWFISLIFPNGMIGDDDYTNGKARYFKKFIDKLRYKYKFRFIKKVEWKAETGIHFHLIGSFSKKFTFKNINKVIRKLWSKTIGISDAKLIRKSANVKRYKKLHNSYLTRESKCKNDMRCIELIGKCDMYSIINKKYFKFCKKEIFALLEIQFEYFCSILIDYLDSIGKDTRSYIKQIERVFGMISFIPHEKIIELYDLAASYHP